MTIYFAIAIKTKSKLANIILVMIFIIACTACIRQTEFSDKERASMITQISMSITPMPKFIAKVSPFPNEQVSLEEFQRFDKHYLPVGIPNKTTGYDKALCVELNIEYLVDNDDKFTSFEATLPRLTLIVDNVIASKVNRASSSDILIIDESKLAQYTSPHIFCWEVDLVKGIHEVEFQFERSSGQIEKYIWYVEILD